MRKSIFTILLFALCACFALTTIAETEMFDETSCPDCMVTLADDGSNGAIIAPCDRHSYVPPDKLTKHSFNIMLFNIYDATNPAIVFFKLPSAPVMNDEIAAFAAKCEEFFAARNMTIVAFSLFGASFALMLGSLFLFALFGKLTVKWLWGLNIPYFRIFWRLLGSGIIMLAILLAGKIALSFNPFIELIMLPATMILATLAASWIMAKIFTDGTRSWPTVLKGYVTFTVATALTWLIMPAIVIPLFLSLLIAIVGI